MRFLSFVILTFFVNLLFAQGTEFQSNIKSDCFSIDSTFKNHTIDSLKQRIKAEPQLTINYFLLGNVQLFSERKNGLAGLKSYVKNIKEAILNYNQAIKLDSNFAVAYLNRGIAYNILYPKRENAIIDYSKSILVDSLNHLAYLYRGANHLLNKNFELAILDYNKVIKLGYPSPCIYVGLAFAKSKLGKNLEACKDLEMSLKLDSKFPENILSKYSNSARNIYLQRFKKFAKKICK